MNSTSPFSIRVGRVTWGRRVTLAHLGLPDPLESVASREKMDPKETS